MTTGRINYSPDYKSEPQLPEGWGLIEAFCADGRHRFLPDAPRCGCGKTINRAVERARLEREVVEAAIEEYKIEHAADRGANTITRTDALIKLQPLMQRRREAVAALLKFESENR